ncbi:MAG: BlaI/MecI/CopY family transcriptional regulator [Pirellulaceae bacterium]|nr:BlaI/MecI/CopY family transcriptional regulator [Pirellulaceae bacterium]
MPKIGKEELAVFQYVHSHAPVSVREVADHFADHGKARTTVLTVMERLRDKGILERDKVAGTFRYRGTVDSSSMMRSLIGDFVNEVLGGSVSPFIAYMSESDQLSSAQIQELKAIIEDLDDTKIKSRARGKSR